MPWLAIWLLVKWSGVEWSGLNWSEIEWNISFGWRREGYRGMCQMAWSIQCDIKAINMNNKCVCYLSFKIALLYHYLNLIYLTHLTFKQLRGYFPSTHTKFLYLNSRPVNQPLLDQGDIWSNTTIPMFYPQLAPSAEFNLMYVML